MLPEMLAEAGMCPEEAQLHINDFNLAVLTFGEWTDARREATKLVDAPKQKGRPKVPVPKYRTFAEIIGEPPPDRKESRPTPPTESHPVLDEKVEQLRRNPKALLDFMREIGEA